MAKAFHTVQMRPEQTLKQASKKNNVKVKISALLPVVLMQKSLNKDATKRRIQSIACLPNSTITNISPSSHHTLTLLTFL